MKRLSQRNRSKRLSLKSNSKLSPHNSSTSNNSNKPGGSRITNRNSVSNRISLRNRNACSKLRISKISNDSSSASSRPIARYSRSNMDSEANSRPSGRSIAHITD